MPDKTLLDAILAPGGLSVLFQPIYAIKDQNHRLMAEIRPDIVKVDRYFVNGSRGNDAILAANAAIVVLARLPHSTDVREGGEALADRRSVYPHRNNLVQGYLIARL